jgi:hypothetical protein
VENRIAAINGKLTFDTVSGKGFKIKLHPSGLTAANIFKRLSMQMVLHISNIAIW